MLRHLLLAVALGATSLACTPAPGASPATTGTPDVVAPSAAAPSGEAPSGAAPTESMPTESASPAAS